MVLIEDCLHLLNVLLVVVEPLQLVDPLCHLVHLLDLGGGFVFFYVVDLLAKELPGLLQGLGE